MDQQNVVYWYHVSVALRIFKVTQYRFKRDINRERLHQFHDLLFVIYLFLASPDSITVEWDIL